MEWCMRESEFLGWETIAVELVSIAGAAGNKKRPLLGKIELPEVRNCDHSRL